MSNPSIAPPSPTNFSVLLVEDDDVATESVLRSFKRHGIGCTTVTACDGLEALSIIRGEHENKQLQGPYLVLLDLNMPRMDGFEFLHVVRADPKLKQTVIFILTTSSRDADRARAYEENVAGYMVKSAVGPQFSLLASFLDKYATSNYLPAP
ncbi:response regulator [Curvibacter sp. CHRR-16]|uniref:response regulator n=1 Tax=Curvibacter sp. CHRR-16 TaxID=2835872 RepID=UPI001BDAAD5C|nr:response regulator [Curvibacter sp. CHRR-16]MBT0571766.1 response regulator [Curvibacter sp. CHRR-16]